MNGTPYLHRYEPSTRATQDKPAKYYCTFLKELRSEIPVSQQLRIPLVSLETVHLSKMGQAKTRVEYIRTRYDALTKFLVETWTHAPLRAVNPPAPEMKDAGNGANKRKREAAADAAAALAEQPQRFRDLLSVLHTRANAVSDAICGPGKDGKRRHGIGKDGKRMLEDALTSEMVNGDHGETSLPEALDKAGFKDATYFHQYTLNEGRPDITLTNLKIIPTEEGNQPIIVEAKKRTRKAFEQPSERKSNKHQVEEYRKELKDPSPYSILFNFASDTTDVQFRWAIQDSDGQMHWHDWAPPS